MKKGLMTKEFYTMEENKAKEGLVNGSWGIVSDLHNYVTENQSMKYVPLGHSIQSKVNLELKSHINQAQTVGLYQVRLEHPEDVVKLAISLQVAEVNYLGQYGIKRT